MEHSATWNLLTYPHWSQTLLLGELLIQTYYARDANTGAMSVI